MKIKFIIVSKDQKFEIPQSVFDGISEAIVEYIEYNTAPLGDVYNNCLDRFNSAEFDYLFFMHSDVTMNIPEFIQHLKSIHGKYDVIGLCGTSKLVVSECPLNWFCGSNPCPDERWGCVTHGELNNHITFFSQHHPDITDHEVSCIDGLCIGFSKKAVETGLRFDSSIGAFDCYDTDVCLSAMLKYKLKIGVLVRKDLKHYSVGKSILTDDFLKNEYKLRVKWNLPIPEKLARRCGIPAKD